MENDQEFKRPDTWVLYDPERTDLADRRRAIGELWTLEDQGEILQLLCQKHKHLILTDFYQRLDLSMGAPIAEVDRAHQDLVKLFTPDNPDAYSEEVCECAQEIVHLLDEARDALMDPRRRARYNVAMRLPFRDLKGSSRRKRRLAARTHYERGQTYLHQKRYPRACRAFLHAISLGGDNPAFLAGYGWALYCADPNARSQAVSYLKRALTLDSRCDDAHFYMGVIHRQRGEVDAAKVSFNLCWQANPARQDALRHYRDLCEEGREPASELTRQPGEGNGAKVPEKD